MRAAALLAVSLAFISPVLRAEDSSAREDEIFGTTPLAPAEPEGKSDRETREDDLFGDSPVQSPGTEAQQKAEQKTPAELAPVNPSAVFERASAANDKLAIGGRLFNQDQISFHEGEPLKDGTLSLPTLLDVYLDGRPNDRLRAYIRGRLTYDPSQVEGRPAAFGGTQTPLVASLDQLWLKWDAYQRVFFTFGRQRVKWGAGRFWNPTDFLNPQRLNALAIVDTRLGATLFKVHVPVESLGWNFYAIANLTGASTPGQMGGALRGEFVLGTAEVTLSAQVRNAGAAGGPSEALVTQAAQSIPGATADNLRSNLPTANGDVSTLVQLGADISAGVGPLDLRLEGALTHGNKAMFVTGPFSAERLGAAFLTPSGGAPLPAEFRDEEWIGQVVAGAEMSVKYSDEDSVGLGAEYFFNGAGTGDSANYGGLLLVGNFTPFYLGRHYAAVYASLLNPGTWNNTAFTVSCLGNLSDQSFLARLDYSVTVLTNLTVRAFGAYHFGNEGEFRFGGAFSGLPIGTTASASAMTPVVVDAGVGFILNI